MKIVRECDRCDPHVIGVLSINYNIIMHRNLNLNLNPSAERDEPLHVQVSHHSLDRVSTSQTQSLTFLERRQTPRHRSVTNFAPQSQKQKTKQKEQQQQCGRCDRYVYNLSMTISSPLNLNININPTLTPKHWRRSTFSGASPDITQYVKKLSMASTGTVDRHPIYPQSWNPGPQEETNSKSAMWSDVKRNVIHVFACSVAYNWHNNV